jgi:hypothetical protein
MTSATEMADNKDKEEAPSGGGAADPDAPSGFILKLYQMVNGAPNEVISVSCSQSPRSTLVSLVTCSSPPSVRVVYRLGESVFTALL